MKERRKKNVNKIREKKNINSFINISRIFSQAFLARGIFSPLCFQHTIFPLKCMPLLLLVMLLYQLDCVYRLLGCAFLIFLVTFFVYFFVYFSLVHHFINTFNPSWRIDSKFVHITSSQYVALIILMIMNRNDEFAIKINR